MNTSFTNVPSVLNTWMRSLVRSQTYSSPSLASATPCTGVRNCWAGGSFGIVRRELRVVGLVAVGAPVPLVLAGIRVEDDHAAVAVAVRDVQLVRLRIDQRLGRQPEIRRYRCCPCSGSACRSASGTFPLCVNFRTKLSCTAPAPPSCSHPSAAPRAAAPRPLPPIQTLPL